MLVTIKDKDALMAIDSLMLSDYFAVNEWEVVGEILRNEEPVGFEYKKWVDSHHRFVYATVLFDNEWADYSSRVAEALYAIELATGESQLTIYAKLTKQVIVFDGTVEDTDEVSE